MFLSAFVIRKLIDMNKLLPTHGAQRPGVSHPGREPTDDCGRGKGEQPGKCDVPGHAPLDGRESPPGTCTDRAGNTTQNIRRGINIDLTSPTLAPVVSPSVVMVNGTATACPAAYSGRKTATRTTYWATQTQLPRAYARNNAGSRRHRASST